MDDSTPIGMARERVRRQLLEKPRAICPCCGSLLRNDRKGMTRWMALGLLDIYRHFRRNQGEVTVHAATLLANRPGARDHGIALLRHWGLLQSVSRPGDAQDRQKGSRGLSGFYALTDNGRAFVEGKLKLPKNIVKDFYESTWRMEGPLIGISEALHAKLVVNENEIVLDGSTYI